MSYTYIVVGGGIAGVTCVETLSALCPEEQILLIAASKLIKAISNFEKVSRTLEQFDVEERNPSILETDCPNVKVIHKTLVSLDTENQTMQTNDGTEFSYKYLCICTGGKPKIIAKDNPYVIGIRDTESVQEFQKRLHKARRIVVVGNGGIATELVYEVEGCEVVWAIKDKSISHTFIDPGATTFFLPHLNVDIFYCPTRFEVEGCEVVWAIKDKSISHTFIDPGAATFFLPHLNEDKPGDEKKPMKRLKYTEQVEANASDPGKHSDQSPIGSALGPDWAAEREMKGANRAGRPIHVEYQVEVDKLLTPEEFKTSGKSETQSTYLIPPDSGGWPIYVQLTNGNVFGCDFVVSATGVEPNTGPFVKNNFKVGEDGGLCVNNKMETSISNVYAAGDVCTASWEPAPHWLQMRLWSQARQMGAYAAKCMTAKHGGEEIHMDFCFEMFAHVTKFFNYKVILLGKFNAQGLDSDHELLLRMTKGQEYIKAVLHDGRLQGAILIGETDLEETFENLILNQTDLTPFKDDLLDPNIDIEDFFD